MTQVQLEPMPAMTQPPTAKPLRLLSLPETFFLAPAVLLAPRHIGQLWQRIPLWRATVVAAVNLAALPVWSVLLISVWQMWSLKQLRTAQGWAINPRHQIASSIHDTLKLAREAVPAGVYNTFLASVLFVFLMVLLVSLVFFVLLPFAARPGSNGACARHVARTALLSTGLTHLWMAALTLNFVALIASGVTGGPVEWMPPVFSTVCFLLGLTLFVLIRAVRIEYRRDSDMPKEKLPQCDACGYDLHMTDPTARCPECGKPVIESLGSEFRQPLPWEKTPNLTHPAIIRRQLWQTIVRPRDLFFHMPTLSGQRAAQRWLLLSMTAVGAVAFWTFPAMALQLRYGYINPTAPRGLADLANEITFSGSLVLTVCIGGLAMAMLWAVFGMLMVGIETAGVAAVARFRKNTVPLASAAKVTCYASPLMAPWALLGGAQIVLLILAYQRGWMFLRPNVEQIALVATTAVAHIGGLLWFEFTVYRGLRSIQYANH